MMFPLIESLTESSVDSYVYFNNFGFRKSLENNTGSVNLSGGAINYPALYRQINNFRNSEYVYNLKMNNLALDDFGNVIFSISFDTDVSTSGYLKYINNAFPVDMTTGTTSSGPLFQRDPGAGQGSHNATNATTSTTTTAINATTTEPSVNPSSATTTINN